MALQDVLVWRIDTGYTGTWSGQDVIAGRFLHVRVDPADYSLSVDLSSTQTENSGVIGTITTGPNLAFPPDGLGTATLLTAQPFWQACQGTTLRKVGSSNTWPYGTISNNFNSAECQPIPVCDLDATLTSIIQPTGPLTADGQIQVAATSSNGTPKFSLDSNFNYGSEFPGASLEALANWLSANTSTEPFVWTTGVNPLLTLTAPTIQSNSKSDQLYPPQGWITGNLYRVAFSFTITSPANVYVFIRIVVRDAFDVNLIGGKTVAGYAVPTGTLIEDTWQFIAPAGMFRLAVYTEHFAVINDNYTLVINYFNEIGGSVDDPGVNTTGLFTGLLPGTYTIYSKDAAGCTDQVTAVVEVTTVYNVRFRAEFDDIFNRRTHRINILERSYAGVIEEVCSGETPGLIRFNADENDTDLAVIPSEMTISLLSEMPLQFIDLFLGDDRQFKAEHYIKLDADLNFVDLYWSGFVAAEFYSEPYLKEPFPVEIKVIDGLGELKEKDFVDASGNVYKNPMRLIEVIAEILKKTDLGFQINAGINLIEDTIMVDTDDPLDVIYLDPLIFKDKKCDEVLKAIPFSFRARIFQSAGAWWITRNSDAVGTFNYRTYDANGVLLSDSSLAPVIALTAPRLSDFHWVNRSQNLSFIRNYGYFSVTQDLAKDGDLAEGAFEAEDIVDLGSGNQGFKDWNVTIGQAGVKFGFEKLLTTNGTSKGSIFFDFDAASGTQGPYASPNDTVLYSIQIPFDNQGLVKFKFDYKCVPRFNMPWIRLRWSVQTVAGVPSFDPQWFTPSYPPDFNFAQQVPVINELYITEYNTWKHFELLGESGVGVAGGYIEIKFYMHNHYGRDFQSIADLRTYDIEAETGPNRLGRKVMVNVTPQTYLYVSAIGDYADDGVNVIRPTNYGAEKILWMLEEIIDLSSTNSLVSRFNIDNVGLEYFYLDSTNSQPTEPRAEELYAVEVSKVVIPNFNKVVVLGDLFRFNTTTVAVTKDNEELIYNAWYRDLDGLATATWHRLGVVEEKKLLQILLEDMRDQFSASRKKLTGQISGFMHYYNAINDNWSGGRFMHTVLEYNLKRSEFGVNLVQVVTGSSGEPPLHLGSFVHDAFTEGFKIGS